MRGVVVVCGSAEVALPAHRPHESELRITRVPSRPGRSAVDPLLGEIDYVLVAGTDADFGAVVTRILRADRLRDLRVGFLSNTARSAVVRLWALSTNPENTLDSALHGRADNVPLIRDDSGGVLLGQAALKNVVGEVYCDDQRIMRNKARHIVVQPDPSPASLGIQTTVHTGLLRPATKAFGRACQIGCEPTVPIVDGHSHPRPVTRWTWYRHTQDLRLIR